MKSDKECRSCGKKTGYIYAGPVYAEEEFDQAFCPWCIADGSAAEEFDATFTDESGIGDGEVEVSPEVEEEVSRRTPGFSGWQQERWLGCCDDAAAFLGPMGRKELEQLGRKAVAAVHEECGFEDEEWTSYLTELDRDNGPTATSFAACIAANWKHIPTAIERALIGLRTMKAVLKSPQSRRFAKIVAGFRTPPVLKDQSQPVDEGGAKLPTSRKTVASVCDRRHSAAAALI